MVTSKVTQGSFIYPNWDAPAHVSAYTSCRAGGGSLSPFDSFNVAQHVGDDEQTVNRNRLLLPHANNITWLQQVHSNQVIELPYTSQSGLAQVDASFSHQVNQVCAVMTADCLPLLICDDAGTVVAAVHAGWRGLAERIIENTVERMGVKPVNLMVWLGPAISQASFEVGPEVKEAFSEHSEAFIPSENFTLQQPKYLADLYMIAKQKLASLGVSNVSGGEYCTYLQESLFFSHRRVCHQGLKTTGRMVSAIYLNKK